MCGIFKLFSCAIAALSPRGIKARMTVRPFSLALVVLTLSLVALLPAVSLAADPGPSSGKPLSAGWPNWRGPNHDGVSLEKGWLTVWPKEGLRQLWQVELGPGHSSVAVVAGKVYSMGRTAQQDTVFGLNANTGETLWKYSYNAAPSAYGLGPRATPAVDGNCVYTLSADGQALCLEATTGAVLWQKDLPKELKLVMPRHNFSTSPVVAGALVLFNVGASGLALDKRTGNVVWKSDGDSSYSSPVPFTLGARPCVALFAASQLAVVDLASGQTVASSAWKSRDNCNCADPVIAGNAILVSSTYGGGSALIDFSKGQATNIWQSKQACAYASPVLVGDNLYALIVAGWEKADLVCMNVKDGCVKWTQKDVGSGGLLAADGKLIVLSRNGALILLEAASDAVHELARAKIFSTGACWNCPVLCDGCIYAKNEKGTLVCLDVRGK